MTRRYYAVAELPEGSRLAREDRVVVLAFASRSDRDAWVSYPDRWYAAAMDADADLPGPEPQQHLSTYGESRRPVRRDEARTLMGGYPLEQIATSWTEEALDIVADVAAVSR